MPIANFAACWRDTPQIDEEDVYRKLVELADGGVELVNRAIRAVASPDRSADLTEIIHKIASYIASRRRHEEDAKRAAPV